MKKKKKKSRNKSGVKRNSPVSRVPAPAVAATPERLPLGTEADFLEQMSMTLRNLVLRKSPTVKEYHKIRKLHGEIMESMVDYYNNMVDRDERLGRSYFDLPSALLELLCTRGFVRNSQEGNQAFFELMVYKTSPDQTCLTEVFLNKHRYRKPEKLELLQGMLNSRIGLFEFIEADWAQATVRLKNMLDDTEVTIVDIGMSSSFNNFDNTFLYTRIITCNGISFGTGLNLVFKKEDPFIKKMIAEYGEMDSDARVRCFLKLFKKYITSSLRETVRTNLL